MDRDRDNDRVDGIPHRDDRDYLSSRETEEVRRCPNCSKERPPTGGGFCNSYCTFQWNEKREIENITRGGAPYVFERIGEPYRTWIAAELHRKDAALDAARDALVRLSKTGSLARATREEALRLVTEARNERLF